MQKMVMALVPRDQTEPILEALVAAGYTATVTDSRGGVLRQAQHMLYMAVTEENLAHALTLLRQAHQSSHSSYEAKSAGDRHQTTGSRSGDFDKQVIFVWDLDRFEIY